MEKPNVEGMEVLVHSICSRKDYCVCLFALVDDVVWWLGTHDFVTEILTRLGLFVRNNTRLGFHSSSHRGH